MHAASFDVKTKIWTQKIAYQQYYSVQTVCTILGVGSPSIYSALHRGTLKGYRVGGVAHVKHEDLMAYIARRNAIPMVDRSNIEAILPRAKAPAMASLIPGVQAMVSQDQPITDLFDDDDDDDEPTPIKEGAEPEAVEAIPAS